MRSILVFCAFIVMSATAHADGLSNNIGANVAIGAIGSSISRQVQTVRPNVRPAPSVAPSRAANRQIQENLNILGFSVGIADGYLGRRSRQAIAAFQTSIGSNPSGELLPFEIEALQGSAEFMIERGARRDAAILLARRNFRLLVAGAKSAQLAAQQTTRGPNVVAETAPAGVVARPTRKFAGPSGYPAKDFRGYGVVAFKSTASEYDRERYNIICSAYSSAMISSGASGAPTKDQFVTIWPVADEMVAKLLNRMPQSKATTACPLAIDHYDKQRAEETIAAAKAAGFSETGIGPFLIGWLPSSSFGKSDALILFLDLSKVNTYEQANSLFSEWKLDIESDPDLLKRGFSLEILRRKLRRWLDQNGESFLRMVKAN